MATPKTCKHRIGSATASLAAAAGAALLFAAQQRKCESLSAQLRAYTSLVQQQHRQGALNHQHRLHFDLLCKAMDDPTLAAVLDTYEEEVGPEVRRQYLFANALYINAVHAHRAGAMNLLELHGHLRVMCQNAPFRDYWAATKPHRASLPDTSQEAEIGRMVDELIRELDDAETDEWWVVGEPPIR
ncbi:DUF6082 family protein [Streptomyces boluensis]|uniref:Secreted protein n=1 Tax=Streptomyces boluensis TaxID=1775135 RepID=A0A964UQF6_9ACTN|nr:DUF6082 family protein [Streptomyces boluensis]NBE51137.1 hypothetical protein [Streptomyces boluensis]